MSVPLKRVLVENRSWVAPLAVVFALNVAVYALAVYPLSVKVSRARARAEAAGTELAAARRDSASAQAARTARDRANAALRAFYSDVLPRDFTGANRITYLPLDQLAQTLKLRLTRRSTEPEKPDRDGTLWRLKISATLTGDYSDIRQFIYRLETAPEFVVIEDIVLAESGEPGSPMVLTLGIATYYQARADGT